MINSVKLWIDSDKKFKWSTVCLAWLTKSMFSLFCFFDFFIFHILTPWILWWNPQSRVFRKQKDGKETIEICFQCRLAVCGYSYSFYTFLSVFLIVITPLSEKDITVTQPLTTISTVLLFLSARQTSLPWLFLIPCILPHQLISKEPIQILIQPLDIPYG